MTLRTLLFAAPILSVLSLAPERAHACGGLYCSQTPVLQTSERIVFALEEDKTVAYIQLNYVGNDPSFAWIIPVPDAPKVEVGVGQAMFTALEDQTKPVFIFNNVLYDAAAPDVANAAACGGGGSSAGAGDPRISARFVPTPKVDVLDSARVGPYDYVTLTAHDATDLNLWLGVNGYRVLPGSDAVVQTYLDEGMKLLALKLAPEENATAIEPVKLSYPGMQTCTIPIRLTAIAAQPGLEIVVWVFGEVRAVPKNYAAVTLDAKQLSSPAGYVPLMARTIDSEAGGHGFVTELARPTAYLDARGDATLAALLEKNPYVTRLRTQLDPNEMTIDPEFIADPQGEDQSNEIDLGGGMSLGAGAMTMLLALAIFIQRRRS